MGRLYKLSKLGNRWYIVGNNGRIHEKSYRFKMSAKRAAKREYKLFKNIEYS